MGEENKIKNVNGYGKENLEKLSLQFIENENLVFIRDVVSFLPCCASTFYNYELDKLDTIKEALTKNKLSIKRKLRQQFYESDSAPLKIALYKLLADKEEYDRLNGTLNVEDGVRQVIITIGDKEVKF